MLPLHSAIVDDVAEYIATLPSGSPLFPNIKRDQDGKRAHNAGNTIQKWLRKTITKDSRKTFHSHRHAYKTLCRGLIDQELRNYLMGHKTAGVAAEYGRYPIKTLAEEIEKIDPLADREHEEELAEAP